SAGRAPIEGAGGVGGSGGAGGARRSSGAIAPEAGSEALARISSVSAASSASERRRPSRRRLVAPSAWPACSDSLGSCLAARMSLPLALLVAVQQLSPAPRRR